MAPIPRPVWSKAATANFYGTTYSGGVSNAGAVFRYSLGNGLIPLYNFTGGEDGANPQGALVEGSDSNFYGTTFGGATAMARCFGSARGNLTVLWIFGDGSDGGNPEAGLILGQDEISTGRPPRKETTVPDGIQDQGTKNGAS